MLPVCCQRVGSASAVSWEADRGLRRVGVAKAKHVRGSASAVGKDCGSGSDTCTALQPVASLALRLLIPLLVQPASANALYSTVGQACSAANTQVRPDIKVCVSHISLSSPTQIAYPCPYLLTGIISCRPFNPCACRFFELVCGSD